MSLQITTDTNAILRVIEPVLAADPVRNTIFGSVRASLQRPGGDGWCAHDGAAVAVRGLPVTPVALTEGWTDLGPLADQLAVLPSLTAIGGPVASVDRVVTLLGREPGCGYTSGSFASMSSANRVG